MVRMLCQCAWVGSVLGLVTPLTGDATNVYILRKEDMILFISFYINFKLFLEQALIP